MHLSRSSSPWIFHLFVTGILVASFFLDGWPWKHTHILHQRLHQFQQRPWYEVLTNTNKMTNFSASVAGFSSRWARIFVRSISTTIATFSWIFAWFVSIMMIVWLWAFALWLRRIMGSVVAVTLSIILLCCFCWQNRFWCLLHLLLFGTKC